MGERQGNLIRSAMVCTRLGGALVLPSQRVHATVALCLVLPATLSAKVPSLYDCCRATGTALLGQGKRSMRLPETKERLRKSLA